MTIIVPSGLGLVSTCLAGLIWLLIFLLFIYSAAYCWRTGTIRAEKAEREREQERAKGGDSA